MKTITAVLAAAALASTAMAGYAPDKVSSLPGWSGDLPSDMYAGYLDIAGGKHLSYVVAESESDPANDPVVFWFNGGPGCSSLGGFATENGPFFITKDSSGGFSLRQRPERWNKEATTVYMENPAGVGFSYADSSSGYVHNDTSTAVDNFNALQEFFNKFPEWKSNDLYFTGESYAGIYIPTLAAQVVAHNKAGGSINLKGIAVGNGCIGTEVGTCGAGGSKYNFEFLNGQGFLSPPTVKAIEDSCDDWVNPSLQCQEALAASYTEQGKFNIYDVYVECGALAGDDDTGAASQATRGWTVGNNADAPAEVITDFEAFLAARFKHRPATELEKKLLGVAWARGMYNGKPLQAVSGHGAAALSGTGPTDGPCVAGNTYTKYFNDAKVRAALHMQPASKIGEWVDCTSKISYTSTEPNEPRDIYPTLIENMRVLIYNGAFDDCVPWTDNVEWTYGMGYDTKTAWHPWYVDGTLAGHAVYWDQGKGFGFTTIQAAGHLVPEYQPKFGYAMLQSVLNNQDL